MCSIKVTRLHRPVCPWGSVKKAQVNRLFAKSRSSAGSRTIKAMLREESVVVGRFKVRRLMRELGLFCEQPGPLTYKQATVERSDIPNHLGREFAVEQTR